MNRIRAAGRRMSRAAVVAIASGLIIGPEEVSRKAEDAAAASWRAAGRALVARGLDAMDRQIHRDRASLEDARATREALLLNLRSLEARRCVDGGRTGPAPEAAGQGASGPLDEAIEALGSALDRADRRIADLRLLLGSREDELQALRAQARARGADRDLGDLEADRSRWQRRSGLVAEALGGPGRSPR